MLITRDRAGASSGQFSDAFTRIAGATPAHEAADVLRTGAWVHADTDAHGEAHLRERPGGGTGAGSSPIRDLSTSVAQKSTQLIVSVLWSRSSQPAFRNARGIRLVRGFARGRATLTEFLTWLCAGFSTHEVRRGRTWLAQSGFGTNKRRSAGMAYPLPGWEPRT